jgi:hypothetical protein
MGTRSGAAEAFHRSLILPMASHCGSAGIYTLDHISMKIGPRSSTNLKSIVDDEGPAAR